MLTATVFLVGTRRKDSSRIAAAGIRAAQWRFSSRPNRAHRSSVCPPELPISRPAPPYRAQQSRKGTAPRRSICFRLSNRSVWVSSLISRALEDTGAARSPTNTPDSMAPPASTGSTPMAAAMVMEMAPMVADTPKAEPMSMDTPAFIRKVISTTVPGRTKPEAAQMI